MDLESLHASPHPLIISTTGLNPRGQEARRIAVESLYAEISGLRDFRWVTENDGACYRINLMSGDQVLSTASVDLEILPESVAPDVLMWTHLRVAITRASRAVPALETP